MIRFCFTTHLTVFTLILAATGLALADDAKPIFTKNDKLTADDPKDKFIKDSFAKTYKVKLEAEKTYRIDMISSELDSFLRLEDSVGKPVAVNRGFGGDSNSRIIYKSQSTAEFAIVATTSKILRPTLKMTGAFALTVNLADSLDLLELRIRAISAATPKQCDEMASDLKKRLQALGTKVTNREANLARTVAVTLERTAPEQAVNVYKEFGKLVAAASDEQAASVGRRLEGCARRLSLVGNTMEFKGTSLDGKEIHLAKLKGKVVLIDFWITSYSPSTNEIPAMKLMYTAYRDRGFEIVAVSMDQTKDGPTKFMAQRELPWPCIHDDQISAQSLSAYCGVWFPPLSILIDREGKVVSLTARGAELEDLLEKHIGPSGVEKKARTGSEPPELIPEIERQQFIFKSRKLNEEGTAMRRAGSIREAVAKVKQALEIDRKLYPKSTFPNGNPDLIATLSNLGTYLQLDGKLDEAKPHIEEALAINRLRYPKDKFPSGHQSLALSLNNLAYWWKAAGDYDRSQRYYEEALKMYRELYPIKQYPQGNAHLAACLSNFGFFLRFKGEFQQALPYLVEALDMRRALFPKEIFPLGHTDIAQGLNNLGTAMQDLGRFDAARDLFEESMAMRRKLYPKQRYPNGHFELAIGLNNIGLLQRTLGEYDRARASYLEALEMYQAIFPKEHYPDGHPWLAVCLNNLALAMDNANEPKQARDYYQQCLAMRTAMYPKVKFPAGHPELVSILNNLAGSLKTAGDFNGSRKYYEEAVAMGRRLYPKEKFPNGHPDLATTQQNLALILEVLEDMNQARELLEESLASRRATFPKEKYPFGHGSLAYTLENTAKHYKRTGDLDRAANLYQETVVIRQALAEKYLASASEAEAIAFLPTQQAARDGFVSLAADASKQIVDVYPFVWQTKAMLTRILERRHALARIAGTEYAADYSRLGQLRRQTESLLQNDRIKPADRDIQLAKLADDRDDLERKLARALPMLDQWKKRDRLGPEDLVKALPKDAAFVDILRYERTLYPTKKIGAREVRTPSYAAFVLAPGQTTQRIELGDAASIDRLVYNWRTAIEARKDSESAADLHTVVWTKVAAKLPPGCKSIYMSLDGDLARVPWAALPGAAPDTVLLEDYALAVVPHGPFLLEHLQNPPQFTGADSILALSDLAYGMGKWQQLPGTAQEATAIGMLAPKKPVAVAGADGTRERLAEILPTVRIAHLATHGEFKAKELQQELLLERAQLGQASSDGTRRTAGKNPLGFTGLVLSQGEVLTGLSLVDLKLENLQLVTLSACETGLGDNTGGEGVFGLQRAFHLAGAHNVVASLWNVSDAATAALMAKFYHELWTNKKPPIEALREAQLMVYHRPDMIADLSGVRGAPSLKRAVEVKSADPIPKGVTGKKKADTKLWAAFVLSGVGK